MFNYIICYVFYLHIIVCEVITLLELLDLAPAIMMLDHKHPAIASCFLLFLIVWLNEAQVLCFISATFWPRSAHDKHSR